MSATDTYENKHLDAAFGDGHASNMPATWYIGLFTTMPVDAGTGGVEPVGNGYARVGVANTTVNWPNATSGQKKNGTVITFPTATGSWGTILGWGAWDALAGTLAHFVLLGSSVPVTAGMTPAFAINALVVTAD